ncbi:MAG: enoyl-CoA hydratase/isomerase family protein [Dehalococcoidia bacterium]|nr:enoyl-CoA hydratase/isomerase family protein [Dehalococcoidia bacterium]
MDATYNTLLLDRVGTDGRVGRITLNRPEKLNTLSPELLFELNDALHAWEADNSVRVIVLRGAGRAFSAGYDLTPYKNAAGGRRPLEYAYADEQSRRLLFNVRTSMQQITDIQMYFWNMAKVTIAELQGYCLAGGCELAMMADLVVASEDCQIGHPGVRGLGYPRNGAIWPLVMGMRKTKELSLSGSSVSGTEAERIGMINYAWPKDQLEQKTIAFADYYANMTADHLALLKAACNRWYENMGIYSSIRSSTEMDAMGQFTGEAYAWQDKMRESMKSGGGLKEALDWRDGRYGDYRTK